VNASIANPRRYRGVTPAERKARRRDVLVDSALELFGTVGYHETSVRAICQQASLNQRYFYESFESREQLLTAVYLEIVEEVSRTALAQALMADGIEEKIRAGVGAWWSLLAADKRKARIICIEVLSACDALKDLQRQTRTAVGAFMVSQGLVAVGRDDGSELLLDPMLVARSLIGAAQELLVAHIRGEVESTVDELIEYTVTMFMTVTGATIGSGALQ
jgi:AcrR family transcriptional regulator